VTTSTRRPPEQLARAVLSVEVKDRILQWILEGRLAPGSRIVETRVARDLGTSQAPVRDALRDLANLGVIEMEPYRGARVRRPSRRDLVEAMEVRGQLDAIAARRVVDRMTPDIVAELEALIDEMLEFAKAGDALHHALVNTAFHACIVRASGNRTLERIWSMLDPYARTYVTSMVPGTDLLWLGRRHIVVLDALLSGDPDLAAETMRAHAREAENLVMAMDDAVFDGDQARSD
jgi:DNA-binding GntR family transcriptional regulator